MASRKGGYLRRELSLKNAGGPVWLGVTVTSPGEPTVTGNLFVPRTPEVFTHDPDGNLTSDGRWSYSWDAENRLLRVQSRSDTPQASWRRDQWQYDALGRWIRQATWSWLMQSNLWVVTEDVRMVSNPLLFGRHLLELNATNNVPVRTYVWGLDLSETMDGAGRVGGLRWITLHPGSGAGAGTHFCAYDGNGNVVALASATDGLRTARYEYGSFGEPLRLTGPAATNNPFRFSTKRTDATADLALYEYRAYNPALGRWLSRDPIEEVGGRNLYAFVVNVPTSRADVLGLGCRVTFECQLYSETTQGKCDKHCEYVCVEKDRTTIKGVPPATCDDLPQQKITITEGITAWGSLLCRITGGKCGTKGVCPSRIPTHRLYDDIEIPNRDCSRKECIGLCETADQLAKKACEKIQEPARASRKAAAEAARALCIDSCNAWCRRP
jgi:RHS repeat-associated protein